MQRNLISTDLSNYPTKLHKARNHESCRDDKMGGFLLDNPIRLLKIQPNPTHELIELLLGQTIKNSILIRLDWVLIGLPNNPITKPKIHTHNIYIYVKQLLNLGVVREWPMEGRGWIYNLHSYNIKRESEKTERGNWRWSFWGWWCWGWLWGGVRLVWASGY